MTAIRRREVVLFHYYQTKKNPDGVGVGTGIGPASSPAAESAALTTPAEKITAFLGLPQIPRPARPVVSEGPRLVEGLEVVGLERRHPRDSATRRALGHLPSPRPVVQVWGWAGRSSPRTPCRDPPPPPRVATGHPPGTGLPVPAWPPPSPQFRHQVPIGFAHLVLRELHLTVLPAPGFPAKIN